MKLKELIKDINVLACTADLDTEIGGICYDSRAVRPGDLFVAIRGFETDGHKYIPKAIAGGAAAVLCEEPPAEGPYILTGDCRLALALASREFFGRPAEKMTVIGITGTNGKTTSSYLIKHMLEHVLGAKVGLIGTNGNMIGKEFIHSERTTPESYELQKLFRRMADSGCSHVVMEVSSHSLTLQRVAGITFDAALYTNLTQDHLDFHGSMEEYAKAKKTLFFHSKAACFNIDDPWAEFMMEGTPCEKLTFSAEKDGAELKAEDIKLSAAGVWFKTVYGGESADTALMIPGMFSVHNALGVIAVGLELGLSLGGCAAAQADAKGVKGRVELVPSDGDYSIIIDYAHTPDALRNVLNTLKPLTRGRLIAVFGCGGDRDHGKRPLMGAIAAENADVCVVTSDNPRTEDPAAIINDILAGMEDSATPKVVICDRREAIAWAIDNARSGDIILLAGKGHEDYQVVGRVKHHMDEREIVAEHLEKRKTQR